MKKTTWSLLVSGLLLSGCPSPQSVNVPETDSAAKATESTTENTRDDRKQDTRRRTYEGSSYR